MPASLAMFFVSYGKNCIIQFFHLAKPYGVESEKVQLRFGPIWLEEIFRSYRRSTGLDGEKGVACVASD